MSADGPPPEFILPPPALVSSFDPTGLILRLMSVLPTLCNFAEVPVHDLNSVDQWRACGNSLLLKVHLAEPDGPKKEVYNVVAIWLRVLATTHQEHPLAVTMLVQQWFNMFGRWPLTIAFFISCMPTGNKPGAEAVPAALTGEIYNVAIRLKEYLTENAKIYCTLPMIPTLWGDNFFLRLQLSRVLRTNPQLSPGLTGPAGSALEPHVDLDIQKLNVNDNDNSPGSSEGASTPRGTTDASDADDSEADTEDVVNKKKAPAPERANGVAESSPSSAPSDKPSDEPPAKA